MAHKHVTVLFWRGRWVAQFKTTKTNRMSPAKQGSRCSFKVPRKFGTRGPERCRKHSRRGRHDDEGLTLIESKKETHAAYVFARETGAGFRPEARVPIRPWSLTTSFFIHGASSDLSVGIVLGRGTGKQREATDRARRLLTVGSDCCKRDR